MLQNLGFDFGVGSAIPYYQDAAFKVDLPTAGAGRFSVFGVGGLSHIDLLGDLKDTTNFYNNPYQDIHQKTGMGAAGISHTYFWNNTSYTKLTLAATGMQSRVSLDSLDSERRKHVQFRDDSWQTRYSLNFQWNKKINARNSLNLGATANLLDAQLRDSTRVESDLLGVSRQFEGKTSLFQINGHWQHRVGENFTLNLGLYSQSLSLNSSVSIEPRMNLRYALDRRQTLSLGLGRHSQMQPLGVYFNQAAGEPVQPNRSLDFTYSNQAVLGYELRFAADWRLQVETYYQAISNVPVDAQPTSFSMLNTGADFGLTDRIGLVNKGTGKNWEEWRYSSNALSAMDTPARALPLFQSRYKGSDGVERNSLFNSGLQPICWQDGNSPSVKKQCWLWTPGSVQPAVNATRPSITGQSALQHRAVYQEDQAYSLQLKRLFRADFKVTLRLNGRQHAGMVCGFAKPDGAEKHLLPPIRPAAKRRLRSNYQLGFSPTSITGFNSKHASRAWILSCSPCPEAAITALRYGPATGKAIVFCHGMGSSGAIDAR